MIKIFSLFLITITSFSGILWILKFLNNKKIKNFNNFYLVKDFSSIFPLLLCILIIRSFILEPFLIPTGSMMPTLLIGDLILVKKFAYNIIDPLFYNSIFNIHKPNRGDIVVFKSPKNPNIFYIKRIIGIPGDKIFYSFLTKRLEIFNSNNKKIEINYSNIKLSNFIKPDINKFKYINNNYLLQRKEKLENKIIYSILINPEKQDKLNFYYKLSNKSLPKWVVPNNQYFVMGDNRDYSTDSRYWGFVPEKYLIGKAVFIWMSFDKKENKWPTGCNFTRIGKIN